MGFPNVTPNKEAADKAVPLLSELGLSTTQARVYLALAKHDILPVSRLSSLSGIARQDTYKILEKLEKVGLVITIPDQPRQYQAIPISEGFSTLILRRVQRTAKLKQEALSIVKTFREKTREENVNETLDFLIIPKKETLYNKAKKMIENTRENMCILGTNRKTLAWFSRHLETFEEALARKVAVRLVLPELNTIQENVTSLKNLREYPTFSLRLESEPILASFEIYDGKEILLSMSVADEVGRASALWSRNRSFVDFAQDYFEVIWKRAREPSQPQPIGTGNIVPRKRISTSINQS